MAIQDFDHHSEPFGKESDYRLYYNSRPHAKALIAINEGIAAGDGFVAVTGETGSGKTTLLNFVLSRLEPGRYVAARLDARECENLPVLRLIARGFGMTATEPDETALEAKLRKFLADSRRRGRRGLLLIDEAQDLPPAAFDSLLDLSRPRDDEGQVLQTVLFGQAGLRDLLYGHDLSRYRLNVVASHHLQALNLEETRRLIDHRLRQTGSAGEKVFAEDSMKMIHLQTGGIPGRVVALCRELMERAAAMGLRRVDGSVTQQLSLKHKMDWVRDETSNEQSGADVAAALHLTTPSTPVMDEVAGPDDALPAFLARGHAEDGDGERRSYLLPITLLSVGLTIGLSALVLFAWQDRGSPESSVTVALSEAERSPEPAVIAEPKSEPVIASEVERATAPEAGVNLPARTLTQTSRPSPVTPEKPETTPEPGGEVLAAVSPKDSQGTPGFTVPAPPPVPDQALPRPDPTPDETTPILAEAASGDGAEDIQIPVREKTPSDEPGPIIEDEAEEQVAKVGSAESLAAADLQTPTTPGKTGGPEEELAASNDAPEMNDQSPSADPIDLTPWKTSDGDATAPTKGTGESQASPIASVGDKTISQPAAARPEAAIVESARLAAAATELTELTDTGPATDIRVTDLVLARRIEDREPLGVGEAFVMDDKEVYAFARVSNTGPRTEVSFRWYLNDTFVGAAEMTVGTSPGWRTWSVAPLDPGTWRVEVADQDGYVLAQRTFEVE